MHDLRTNTTVGHTGIARLCLAQWCYRTRTKLAEIGKQAKFPVPAIDLEGIDPAHFARATELKGSLSRLASFCEKQDPSAIAKAFKPQEIKTVRQYLAVIESWFDCFVVNLE